MKITVIKKATNAKPSRILRSVRRRRAAEQEVDCRRHDAQQSASIDANRSQARLVARGALLLATARCGKRPGRLDRPLDESDAARRRRAVGVCAMPAGGLQQLFRTSRPKASRRVAEDGRPSHGWPKAGRVAPDGLSLDIRLRPGVTFHDGSPVTADAVVEDPQQRAAAVHGPAIRQTSITSQQSRTTRSRSLSSEPSPFLLEALDLPIRKPESPIDRHRALSSRRTNSTQSSCVQTRTTTSGRPAIDRIVVSNVSQRPRGLGRHAARSTSTCCTRSAPMRSIRCSGATTCRCSALLGHYQYVVVFNHTMRRRFVDARFGARLNAAIDREALVRDGLERTRSAVLRPDLAAALGLHARSAHGSSSIRSCSRGTAAGARSQAAMQRCDSRVS